MRVSDQWEISQIFERLKPPNGTKFTGPGISTKDLRDFDIEKVRGVKGFVWVEKPLSHLNSGRSIQQHLDNDRSINNDHRLSRSALTALAGETVGVTECRWTRRLFNSAIVGRSATRRTS